MKARNGGGSHGVTSPTNGNGSHPAGAGSPTDGVKASRSREERVMVAGKWARTSVDRGVSTNRADKSARIDIGLELARRHCRPGEPMSLDVIGVWCGCSDARIWQIEKKALAKLFRKFPMEERPVILEWLRHREQEVGRATAKKHSYEGGRHTEPT